MQLLLDAFAKITAFSDVATGFPCFGGAVAVPSARPPAVLSLRASKTGSPIEKGKLTDGSLWAAFFTRVHEN
ncbi:MAG: hypothetical protein ACLQBD_00040 [Syntrophobacteraceae bacterium]